MQRYVYRFNDRTFAAGGGHTTEYLNEAKLYSSPGSAKNGANAVWVRHEGRRVRKTDMMAGEPRAVDICLA